MTNCWIFLQLWGISYLHNPEVIFFKGCTYFCPCLLIDRYPLKHFQLFPSFHSCCLWEKESFFPDQNICLDPVALHAIKHLLYLFALWCEVLNVFEMAACGKSAQQINVWSLFPEFWQAPCQCTQRQKRCISSDMSPSLNLWHYFLIWVVTSSVTIVR